MHIAATDFLYMSLSYINTRHLLPTFSFLDTIPNSNQSILSLSLSKSFDWQNIDENIIIIRLKIEMQGAEEELERRSKFLNSLIQKKKNAVEQKQSHDRMNVRVRASDMPLPLQNHAFDTCRHILDSMASVKLDSKRLALSLKKVPFFNQFLVYLQLLFSTFNGCVTFSHVKRLDFSVKSSDFVKKFRIISWAYE